MKTNKYYKFIEVHEDGTMRNYIFTFQMGLNTVENFNTSIYENDCPCIKNSASEALYFYNLENIHNSVVCGNTLFEVSCPDDAKIVPMNEYRYKTDKLVVERQVDDEQLLQDIYKKAIQSSIITNLMNFIPTKYRTYDLCLLAVQTDGHKLPYVPIEHRTYELCLLAIRSTGSVLIHVPDEHKTYELCLLAVQSTGRALEYVPIEHKTYELCMQAIYSACPITKYLPDEIKTLLHMK